MQGTFCGHKHQRMTVGGRYCCCQNLCVWLLHSQSCFTCIALVRFLEPDQIGVFFLCILRVFNFFLEISQPIFPIYSKEKTHSTNATTTNWNWSQSGFIYKPFSLGLGLSTAIFQNMCHGRRCKRFQFPESLIKTERY